MKRSRLKNIARKSNLPEDKAAYRRQRNLIVKLNRKQKQKYFDSIDPNNIKSLWNVCKPYLSNKGSYQNKIILLEDDVLKSDDFEVASIFNQYFRDITNTLPIQHIEEDFESVNFPILESIQYFSCHPSVVKIRSSFGNDNLLPFELSYVNSEQVRKYVLSLDSNKSISGNIPINVLKLSVDYYLGYLTNCINFCIANSIFPDELKLADVTPIFKEGDDTDKVNYRPISILPAISKIFERLLFDQLNAFMEPKFHKLICGFCKGHSTQHALLRLLKKWQSCLDHNEIVGTILMDLSKAYDCLNHELLIAKMHAYGIGTKTLRLFYDYLKRRKQRVKIGSIFSDWLNILLGVPQGSILGPLLFNIFINDIISFVEICNICNFADDNSLYNSGKTVPGDWSAPM